jgi:hypothetical protein
MPPHGWMRHSETPIALRAFGSCFLPAIVASGYFGNNWPILRPNSNTYDLPRLCSHHSDLDGTLYVVWDTSC